MSDPYERKLDAKRLEYKEQRDKVLNPGRSLITNTNVVEHTGLF